MGLTIRNKKMENFREFRENIVNTISKKVAERLQSKKIEMAQEMFGEEFSSKKYDAKTIANKMKGHKMLGGFADKVSKMGRVSAKDLNDILPDWVDGGEIGKLFRESIDEGKEKRQKLVPSPDDPKVSGTELVAQMKKLGYNSSWLNIYKKVGKKMLTYSDAMNMLPDGYTPMDGDDQFFDIWMEFGESIDEVLSPSDPIEDWIDDFIKSDAPQFKGKSKEERIEMAKGAYYANKKK